MVVGGGVYLLGQAQVAYQLNMIESFAFGSLISAVDPVATLAIFQALDVDPILYMLILKFVDLHKTPSLEFGLVLMFSYLPYALAEGIHLSGIMAILFCGIVMSHYTHLNLSPVTQITVQQTFRTMAFICETCVFAYLGLAIFSFRVNVKPAFVIWSIGETVDSEHLSELTEEEYEVNFVKHHLKGFLKLDVKYLIPFFTRRFTQQREHVLLAGSPKLDRSKGRGQTNVDHLSKRLNGFA
nr:hypothetical protein BaRGS_022452 [Batillaria attramentaria]